MSDLDLLRGDLARKYLEDAAPTRLDGQKRPTDTVNCGAPGRRPTGPAKKKRKVGKKPSKKPPTRKR